jgi:hypothetical protein
LLSNYNFVVFIYETISGVTNIFFQIYTPPSSGTPTRVHANNIFCNYPTANVMGITGEFFPYPYRFANDGTSENPITGQPTSFLAAMGADNFYLLP